MMKSKHAAVIEATDFAGFFRGFNFQSYVVFFFYQNASSSIESTIFVVLLLMFDIYLLPHQEYS